MPHDREEKNPVEIVQSFYSHRFFCFNFFSRLNCSKFGCANEHIEQANGTQWLTAVPVSNAMMYSTNFTFKKRLQQQHISYSHAVCHAYRARVRHIFWKAIKIVFSSSLIFKFTAFRSKSRIEIFSDFDLC